MFYLTRCSQIWQQWQASGCWQNASVGNRFRRPTSTRPGSFSSCIEAFVLKLRILFYPDFSTTGILCASYRLTICLLRRLVVIPLFCLSDLHEIICVLLSTFILFFLNRRKKIFPSITVIFKSMEVYRCQMWVMNLFSDKSDLKACSCMIFTALYHFIELFVSFLIINSNFITFVLNT